MSVSSAWLDVFDAHTGTFRVRCEYKGVAGEMNCVVWSRDGSRILAGDEKGIIYVWNAVDGKLLHTLEGHTDNVLSISESHDGKLLASKSDDETIRIWHTETWASIMSFGEKRPPNKLGVVGGLEFHPRLLELATRSDGDESIRLWNVDLASLLSKVQHSPSIHYTNAKVVLVGETSTGKSCLARALMGEPFQPQESTHGMKVWNFHSETLERPQGGQITRELMLWDLAGQVDYQVVHQLFLDETVLGVVMFDPTDPDDPFRGVGYWEKALTRVVSDDCSRLLVAGRVDRGHPAATEADIEAFRRGHGYQAFFATSAKTGKGIPELCKAIQQAVPWGRLPITSSPELWKQIREYLLKRRSGSHVLSTRRALRDAFRRQHKGVEFMEAEFDTVIRHAQGQGLVWRLSFGDLILMKPELLNSYAAAIVRVARQHSEGLGCVAERDVLEARIDFEDLKRLPREAERKLLYAVVELFLERELALRGGLNQELLILPSKFNRKLPDLPQPPLREVAYRFAGPVEDIYATLAVRLFYSDAFRVKDLWKNAAEFCDARGRLCGFELARSDEGVGTIYAFFGPATSIDSKVLFLRFMHQHLSERSLPESVKRHRIYRCANCGEEALDRRAIEMRLAKQLQTMPCLYCDATIKLADDLETEFSDPQLGQRVRAIEKDVESRKNEAVGLTIAAAKAAEGEYDVFLAHNSADKLEVEMIGSLLRERGLNPWLDKWNLAPGRRFAEEIEIILPKIKSVAVFVGNDGTGPWQKMEMYAALELFAQQKRPLIPVLLPNAPKEPGLPLFMRQIGWVRFVDRSDREAIDNLVWGITGEHPRSKER